MKVYFIRHGQTNYNLLDLCNNDPSKDIHLTDLEKKQACKVAEKLKDVSFDLVFVSNLPRTQETAKIVTKNQEVRFNIDNRINDRKTGFESRPVSEFFKALEPDIFNLKLNDGESFQEEKKRIISFLKHLESLKYDAILVSTHNEVLKIILGYYKGYSNQKMWDTEIDNCKVFEIDI